MREDKTCCDSDGSREKGRCVAVESSSSRKKMRRMSKTEQQGKGVGLEGAGMTRPCTECGKKFWSWKALFGHMRCHPERQWRGINPPPNLRRRQSLVVTPEDHEVAASLLLLANGNKEQDQEQDQFQCSCCNKVFGSHQALGGHRASHKNVKGCFAITTPLPDHEVDASAADESSVGGGHKCSICLRVFSTGQALGGHKRCHWEKADSPLPLLLIDSNKSSSSSSLDLNFPPDHHHHSPLTLDLRLRL